MGCSGKPEVEIVPQDLFVGAESTHGDSCEMKGEGGGVCAWFCTYKAFTITSPAQAFSHRCHFRSSVVSDTQEGRRNIPDGTVIFSWRKWLLSALFYVNVAHL